MHVTQAAFVSRFQHPPQTTGNEANISAGAVQSDGLDINFKYV